MFSRINRSWRFCPECESPTGDAALGEEVVYWVCPRCQCIWMAEVEEVVSELI